MGFGFVSDMVDDLKIFNPAHPEDSLSYLPFVSAPFAYNQFRQGRSSWETSALSLGIGVGVTELAFWYAGRAAGFTSMEWFLARGATALGVRFGGRSLLGAAFLGSRTTAGAGWGVPIWVTGLLMYEYGMWFGDKVSTAHNLRDPFGKPTNSRDW